MWELLLCDWLCLIGAQLVDCRSVSLHYMQKLPQNCKALTHFSHLWNDSICHTTCNMCANLLVPFVLQNIQLQTDHPAAVAHYTTISFVFERDEALWIIPAWPGVPEWSHWELLSVSQGKWVTVCLLCLSSTPVIQTRADHSLMQRDCWEKWVRRKFSEFGQGVFFLTVCGASFCRSTRRKSVHVKGRRVLKVTH